MYTNSSSYICNIICINLCQSKKAADKEAADREAAKTTEAAKRTEAAKKTPTAPPPKTTTSTSSSEVKINVLLSAMLVRTLNFFFRTLS